MNILISVCGEVAKNVPVIILLSIQTVRINPIKVHYLSIGMGSLAGEGAGVMPSRSRRASMEASLPRKRR